MRLLADENIPMPSVRRLREVGHDVQAVLEVEPGAVDEEVLRHAAGTDRMLLTFDRDYGELIYRQQAPVPPAVLYFRFVPQSPLEVGEFMLDLIEADLSLVGHFVVVERDRIRRRPFPVR